MPVGIALSDGVGRGLLAGAVAVALSFAMPAVCSGQDLSVKRTHTRKAAPIRLGVGGAAAMVSAFRRRHGLPTVRIDSRLMAVARHQAQAMVAHDRLSHDAGGDFGTRLRRAGYFAAAGENIAAGQRSLAEAFAAWVGSPPHRANLLLAGATRIGIASAAAPKSRYRVYWTLVVAAPLVARRGRKSGSLMQAPAVPIDATPEWQ